MRPPVKLIFPSVKLVYVSDGFHGNSHGHLHYKVGSRGVGRLEPQYNVRSLDLDFNNWNTRMLEELLSSLPLLVELKIKGCAQTINWYFVHIWDRMLQNLKALQRVSIDIYDAYPAEIRQNRLRRFHEAVEHEFEICKRINLTLETRTKQPGRGWFQISASLNMD
jgi:hypothetical protein